MKLPERKELLDDFDRISGIDKSAMLSEIEKLPRMLADALALANKIKLKKVKDISLVLIGGMGGSAIGGDIASALSREGALTPCECIRDYSLPVYADSKTVLFLASYSGNTEETLSLLKEAVARKIRMVFIITSGGRLEELAMQHGFTLLKIPAGMQPRAAIAYLSVPILVLMEMLGCLKGVTAGVNEAVSLLEKLNGEFGAAKAQRSNPVKQLANKLAGKTPIIFASQGSTQPAGYRWKTQLNENSKTTAVFSVFPELNHNEMVNLGGLAKGSHDFSLVMLRDEKDHERVKKRMEITKSLIGPQLGGSAEVWSKGESHLARIFSLILFGDYLSVYLALLKGIDPTPVDVITKLKKEMAR